MIIRIRLKDHPEKYVGRKGVTYALACDESRKGRPVYYTSLKSFQFIAAHWFAPEHKANTWSTVQRLKMTLSAAAFGSLKWHETTWTAYEVVHVDTGVVEPLDVFMLPFRGDFPDPDNGQERWWEILKETAELENFDKAKRHYAIQIGMDLMPNKAGQRQDSATDQLLTVLVLANQAGCYDAHDLIQKTLMPETL